MGLLAAEEALHFGLGPAFFFEVIDELFLDRGKGGEIVGAESFFDGRGGEGVIDEGAGGEVPALFGEVKVTRQVIGFQRKLSSTQETIDEVPLSLPPQTLVTKALWDWTERTMEAYRQGGVVGPAPKVPSDASLQTKMLALAGRRG